MTTLLGRAQELAEIQALVSRAQTASGGSLLIRGEAGIGKSALIDAVAQTAEPAGFVVLRTAGAAAEASAPLAALQRLISPCLDRLQELDAPHRQTLEGALSIDDGGRPETFVVALAVLNLFSEAAARDPLLLVVEDAHWLDRETAEVVGFLARRLELEPILLLISTRNEPSSLDDARIDELDLASLDSETAETLLDEHAPELSTTHRGLVLELAQGNPLALIELPRSHLDLHAPRAISLSQRLERAFSERLSDLPPDTRVALLVAAVNDGGDLATTLAASGRLTVRAGSVAVFVPAETAKLVLLASDSISFRHPLVRAAIIAAATEAERRAAHTALAWAHNRDPDRSLWHQAAALSGPNSSVAARLVQAAHRADQRGAPALAAAELVRAAELTADDALRGKRLADAGFLYHQLGSADVAVELYRSALQHRLDEDYRTRVAFALEIHDTATWTGSDRADAIARVAEALVERGNGSAALDILNLYVMRLWWGKPSSKVRDAIVSVTERAAERRDDPLRLIILSHAQPLLLGRAVREEVARYEPDPSDPMTMRSLAFAAHAAFSPDIALRYANAAAEGFRAQGRHGMLLHAVMCRAYTAMNLGRPALALTAADEAERLARDVQWPLWILSAQAVAMNIDAERGDTDRAEALAKELETKLVPTGGPHLGMVQLGRGRGAVAQQRYEDGYFHLRRLVDHPDGSSHPFIALWGISDLIEASVMTGRHEEARHYLDLLERAAAGSAGTHLLAQLAYARPLLAADEDAATLFHAGLEYDLKPWAGYRARLLLAYGRWLRRQRRAAESRAPLRSARELFDGLGLTSLAETARRELRASGETSQRRIPNLRDQLTPQEFQIAQMAAQGLTNREIGASLYLSPRTIGGHLYRLFPKLNISARSQLRQALGEADGTPWEA
jgi:DNA-binding CsgD family transcriptional regulator